MKMKKLLFILLSLILLSGCIRTTTETGTKTTANESQKGHDSEVKIPETDPSKLSSSEQVQEQYSQLDTQKLPTFSNEQWNDVTGNEDDIMNMLEHKLLFYLDSNQGNILEDFNNIKEITDIVPFQKLAISHTPFILGGEGGIYRLKEKYPNHIITNLLVNLTEKGIEVDAMRYKSDIADSLAYLFGEDIKLNENIFLFQDNVYQNGKYFTDEEVYVTFGTWGSTVDMFPHVINYTETEKGYICEVYIVLRYLYFTDNLTELTTIEITKDNYSEYLDFFSKYKYTFTIQDDGHLILTALETIYEPNE